MSRDGHSDAWERLSAGPREGCVPARSLRRVQEGHEGLPRLPQKARRGSVGVQAAQRRLPQVQDGARVDGGAAAERAGVQ